MEVKTKWEDVTVRDFIRIREIDELQMASPEEKDMRVAALLAGISYEELEQMPLRDVREIMDSLSFLFEEPGRAKARRKYEVNGRVYELFKDPSEMTVAQYIDYEAIGREGFSKMPAELLSVFLIPRGHQYNDGYDKEQQIEDMLDLGVEEALGICDFFTRRLLSSIDKARTLLPLMIKVQRMIAPKKDKEILKALEIQTRLMLDELKDMSGLIVSGR